MVRRQKPRTKAAKKAKMGKVMHEHKHGTLTSHGRPVTDRKQAIAIGLSMSGQSKKGRKGKKQHYKRSGGK